jgi:hypothetical protein
MNRRIALFAVPLVMSGTLAHAITLSTPLVGSGPGLTLSCLVTNVGKKPAEVSIQFFDLQGVAIAPAIDVCAQQEGSIAPHASCAASLPEGDIGACVIESNSKQVRGAIEILGEEGNIVEVVPATAK